VRIVTLLKWRKILTGHCGLSLASEQTFLNMEAALIGFYHRFRLFYLKPSFLVGQKAQRFLFLCSLLLLPVMSALANQVVIDEVKIKSTTVGTTIDIAFGLPLEYQKHFPQKYGEIVQIQLRLNDDGTREIHKEVREGGELLSSEGKS